MVTTLRESKAKLSELVEKASHGEDVLITVRGQVKARLTRAQAPRSETDNTAWARSLRKRQTARGPWKKGSLTIEQILEEDRR